MASYKPSIEQEHAALSWKLIEWKIAYYMPERVHPSRRADYEVDDATYDAAEQRYLTLCKKLGLANTLVHKSYPGLKVKGEGMFEVDTSRHSVQLVLSKLGSPKRRKRNAHRTDRAVANKPKRGPRSRAA